MARPTLIRRAVTALFRLFVRTFFRRIEVVGLEHLPPEAPVLFAVNHPNGLVDPLFLLCYAPRPISFLAKAPLFRYPVIGQLARAMESIPVHRKQDNTAGTHAETFARAREILGRGGSIAIFPEGTTHSDPRLRELKTGAARIALGAHLETLYVMPAGIYYTAKTKFRSSALVVFGPPLPVPLTEADADGEPPREAVEALTARIDDALDAVTLQADSHAALELIAFAENLLTANEAQPLAEELELRRRFVDGYAFLRERDPERLEQLESKVRQLAAELGRAGIEAHELVPRFDVTTLFRVIVLIPVAIVGAIPHYPAYRLIRLIAHRVAKKEEELLATVKVLAGMTLYPLTWIALAWLVGARYGAPWGFGTLVLLPLLGWIALRVLEDLDDITGRTRALWHRLFRRRGYEQLVAQRSEIRREVMAVAEEMDARP
ncbi:MAG TPA: lysophospholipid acyltransferase family protein [Thermoanaerobaculia bacterium]|jgi:1-acyl-sn-glycerol-3-phosphate acyltransferase